MLRDARRGVLLERRPPSGIWGGLLSLPEVFAAGGGPVVGAGGGDVGEVAVAAGGVTKARAGEGHSGQGGAAIRASDVAGKSESGKKSGARKSAADGLDGLLARYGLDAVSEPQPAARLRHTFSHFHLDIEVLAVDVRPSPGAVMEPERFVWYKGGQLSGGVAAPVSRLLADLSTTLLELDGETP